MLGGLGPMELTLIFLVVLLIFGGRKIPEVARGLGKGLREFKKARDDFHEALETEAPPETTKPAAADQAETASAGKKKSEGTGEKPE